MKNAEYTTEVKQELMPIWMLLKWEEYQDFVEEQKEYNRFGDLIEDEEYEKSNISYPVYKKVGMWDMSLFTLTVNEVMPDKKYYVSSITPTGIYLDLIKSDIPISELF